MSEDGAEAMRSYGADGAGLAVSRGIFDSDDNGVTSAEVPSCESLAERFGLTEREAEILALITQGLANAEIAERTNLSINSIKTYIRGCYRSIGATSRTNAVLWGIEHGFRPDRVRIAHPEPAPGGGKIVARV